MTRSVSRWAGWFVLGLAVAGCTSSDETPTGQTGSGDAGQTPDAADTGPDGNVPDGNVPDGDVPDGDVPDGDVPDGDVPDGDVPDATADADTEAGDAATILDAAPSGTVTIRLDTAPDAISSYLMSVSPAAWNNNFGEHVSLGRHWDTGHVSYHTALRFTEVPVPQGAQVDAVSLSFYPTNEVDSSRNLWLNVYAEKIADSPPFDPLNHDTNRPDQRLRTSAFIDHWLVRCNAACTDLTEYDCPQRKLDCWDRTIPFTVPKDLKDVVQEVIDLPGWSPGSALTILVINAATDQDGPDYESSRSITGFDPARGPAFSPSLTVTYHTP